MCTILPCPLCTQPCFNSVERLRDKLIYVSTQVLTCPVCQERVSGLDKLTIHLFAHVDVIPPEIEHGPPSPPQYQHRTKQITSCGKTIQPLHLVDDVVIEKHANSLSGIPSETNHSVTQNGSTGGPSKHQEEQVNRSLPASCNSCGLTFADEQILQMHMKLLHDDGDISSAASGFQCYMCDKWFKMKGSLMVHLRVVHSGLRWNSSRRSSKEREERSAQGDDIASSSAAVSPVPDYLPSPALTHPPGSSSPPGRSDKSWFCEVCEKYFTTKYFLKKHKRLHTGETPYSCAQCNKSFTFQQSYHKHLLYHKDDKPHTCADCGRAFKELSTLHNHERIHTGEKPFSCETCGKCFRQRVSYLVHRRIHTGAMPYRCTACDKTFRYKVSQRTHKCPAQPPGTVVRSSRQLLDKLRRLAAAEPEPEGAQLIRAAAALSFEDAEADNFELISRSPPRPHADHAPVPPDDTADVSKKLCLSNCGAASDEFQSNCDTMNLDVIYKELSQYI